MLEAKNHKVRSFYGPLAELRKLGIKNPTVKDLEEHLFGDEHGCIDSNFYICEYDTPQNTIFQRLNRIWVYPLFLVLICPLKWILTGRFGFKASSKTGQLLTKLIGSY